MSSIRRTTATVAAIASLALPLVPSSADATEPTRETVHVTSRAQRTCPSGQVLQSTWEVTREVTTFYDAAGTPVRREVWASGEGLTVNTSTGLTIPTWFVRVFHIDLVTGEQFSTGPNVVVHNLPGGGAFVSRAGRLEFDASGNLVDYHGPDTEAEGAEFCAALAP